MILVLAATSLLPFLCTVESTVALRDQRTSAEESWLLTRRHAPTPPHPHLCRRLLFRVWKPEVRAGRGMLHCELYRGSPVLSRLPHQPGQAAMSRTRDQGRSP